MYLPDLKIGIEYDGAYFNNTDAAKIKENRKNEILKENDITLIRIKEIKDTSGIMDNNSNVIYTKIYQTDLDLSNMIKELIKRINYIKNSDYHVDIDITLDRSDIFNQYINLEKEKSLLKVNPSVAEEWHPKKNEKLLPEHVTPSSNKKVWWLCKEGHEWEAVINSRNKGSGCPVCYKNNHERK